MSKQRIAYEVLSKNSSQTEEFAERIGQSLKGGEVIELVGDVGSGKTTFVRGLARGAGSRDHVSSPTFTVSQIYNAPNVTLHHYDFYRIDDFRTLRGELEEVLQDKNKVVVVEWAEHIREILPADHLRIEFKVSGENERRIEVNSGNLL